MILSDLLLNSPSYLFLLSVNYKNIYYELFILLTIDLFFTNTYGVITIITLVAKKSFSSINNYYIKNILIYLMFIIITSFIYKNDFIYTFKSSVVIQIIGIILFKKAYDLSR